MIDHRVFCIGRETNIRGWVNPLLGRPQSGGKRINPQQSVVEIGVSWKKGSIRIRSLDDKMVERPQSVMIGGAVV